MAAPWPQGRGALAPGPEPAPLAPAGPCRARPALLAALLTLGAALLALEAALCALEAVLLLQLEAAPAAAAAVGMPRQLSPLLPCCGIEYLGYSGAGHGDRQICNTSAGRASLPGGRPSLLLHLAIGCASIHSTDAGFVVISMNIMQY